jgi:hypothetical protein
LVAGGKKMQVRPYFLTAGGIAAALAFFGLFMTSPKPATAQGGPPPVTISPLPVPVVLAPNPLRQQSYGLEKLSDTDGFLAVAGVFVVPPTQRAVVEHVSFTVEVPTGQKVTRVELSTPAFGIGVGTRAVFVPVLLGTVMYEIGGGQVAMDRYAGSQPVRMYFEPGSEARFGVSRNSTNPGRFQTNVYISGHLVPAS